jgi:hypothetical protein
MDGRPRRRQVSLEPRARQARHLLQRAGLLEQVGGAGDDREGRNYLEEMVGGDGIDPSTPEFSGLEHDA